MDGHSEVEIVGALEPFFKGVNSKPYAVIAHNVKGKGVSFMETHGPWHHKIPNAQEFAAIMEELSR